MSPPLLPLLLLTGTAVSAGEQGCPAGWFQCHGSPDCVPQTHNCDSRIHCPDASDEWNCSDVMDARFWDHLFRRQPSADVDKDDTRCGVAIGNSLCACADRSVVCTNLGLTGAPPGVPRTQDLLLLDLTGNVYPRLTASFVHSLPAMDTLVLAHGGVLQVEEAAFPADKPRHALHLDNNHLRTLPEPLVQPGSSLATLILRHNEIRELPEGVFRNLHRLHELDLRHNRLEAVSRAVFEPLTSLRRLYVGDNRLGAVSGEDLPLLPSLDTLSLAGNFISSLQPRTFHNLPALRHLFLSSNRISRLDNCTFQELGELRGLSLAGNGLESIMPGAFQGLELLETLDMQKNSLQDLDINVLQDLRGLQYVYLDEFRLCSAALHVRVCEPHSDGISSFQHLLDNPMLRASVWVMAVVAVSGNIAVLLGRCVLREPNPTHSLYIRSLALADFLMGVYLLLIAAADLRYRGVYLHHEAAWRRSAACSFCGVVSTLSSEASLLVLVVITWDRARSVSRPLVCRPASRRLSATLVLSLWLTAGTAALLPLSAPAYFGPEYYGNNGVCLPLHIHHRFAQGWEYSAVTMVAVSSGALLYIGVSYWRMARVVLSSGLELRRSLERQDGAVAGRFLLIVLTDCLCWTPVIAAKLLALAGVSIDDVLYAWLAVFVLPINSALNPVIYTLTTELFKKQVARMLCVPKSGALQATPSQQSPCRQSVKRQLELSSSLGRASSNRSVQGTYV